MKKELKSGILSADKSADCRPTVGGVNVIAVTLSFLIRTLVFDKQVVNDPISFCITLSKLLVCSYEYSLRSTKLYFP